MLPILISQNDPKWKHVLLGTSNLTLGQAGCTITCVGMKFGITPDFINARLNSLPKDTLGNTGYVAGNLLYWLRLAEALPGVKFVYKYNEYKNDIVLKNLPCLVKVDGAKIGGDRHWVLFIGNQRMYDPWDGTEKPTNTYGKPLSFVVLEGEYKQKIEAVEAPATDSNIYEGLDLTNKESMKIAVDAWVRLKNGELIDKKRYDEMTLAVQENAKRQLQGRLSASEAALFKEELQAVIKASSAIEAWGKRWITILDGEAPVVETSNVAPAPSDLYSLLLSMLGVNKKEVKK